MSKNAQAKRKKKTGHLKIPGFRYEELADHSNEGTFIFQDGKFELTNKRFRQLLGSPNAKAFSHDPEKRLFRDRLKEYQQKAARQPEDHKGASGFRFAMRSKDRGRRDLEVVMTSIEYHGKPAVHGLVRDGTQPGREGLEPTPITIAAHEIRTGMTVIGGSNKMLLKKQLGPLTRSQAGVLKNSSRACDRLRSIVGQVLDHSRLEANRIEMDIRKGNIGDCVTRVYEEWRILAQDKKIALRRRISREAVLAVPLDQVKMEQVLINLTNNAIKNTPEGGRVELQIMPFAESFTKVCVADTGRGVPAEERENVFEAFKQGKNLKDREGLGLGLAICRRIIELHEGEIWVEPRKGGGSKFIFTLPVK